MTLKFQKFFVSMKMLEYNLGCRKKIISKKNVKPVGHNLKKH
jgi:hypothetical protein